MTAHFLLPGQILVVGEASIISTTLGSCVGIALWDSQSGIGGLNHFVLPEPLSAEDDPNRYGLFAIENLIQACLSHGASRRNLVARVFGGASPIADFSFGRKVGELNIAMALKKLAEAGIRVVQNSTGGDYGRTIWFNTSTGIVSEEYLRSPLNQISSQDS